MRLLNLAHRIPETWYGQPALLEGPAEVDDIEIGGKESHKHWDKKLGEGRARVGKVAVVGAADRETNQGVTIPHSGTSRSEEPSSYPSQC